MSELSKHSNQRPTIQTLAQAITSYLDSLENEKTLIPTGLKQIDNVIGGLAQGDLCILAGRPGMGKTAIALQMALHNADRGVCFVSLEMTPEQLARRSLQRYVNLPTDQWSDNIPIVVQGALGLLQMGERVLIGDLGDRKVDRVIQTLSVAQGRGCELGIIDYLQLVQGNGQDRYSQVSHVSEELKQFARHSKMTLLVLAQLSRSVENRDRSGVPRMSDLRDSGQIEQDADQIMLCWRPAAYEPKASEDDLNIVVPKSRHTSTINAPITVHFDRSKQTIFERESSFYDSSTEGYRIPVFDEFNKDG
tara:strand:- start:1934 stop:2851 length:918 start_codon:yes stop_codon:yes gene_type:complete